MTLPQYASLAQDHLGRTFVLIEPRNLPGYYGRVDLPDFERFLAEHGPKEFYVVHTGHLTFSDADHPGHSQRLSRYVLGASAKDRIFYRDRDKLNCRRSNLVRVETRPSIEALPRAHRAPPRGLCAPNG